MFAWLVFCWMLVAVTRDVSAWPPDQLARLFVVLRAALAIVVLVLLLGGMRD